MAENLVNDYGWETADASMSDGYIAPRILEILEKLKVERVLDLGSGSGVLCSAMASKGFEVVGVEYDRRGVEIARQSRSGIKFYNFGVQDDPSLLLSEEPLFDAVVSTEVVEHLFSPHLLPRYAARVLRPNGYLILTTPYHGYLKNLLLSVLGKWDKHHTALWHGGHIKFWSRSTLSTLLVEGGFCVCSFGGIGRFPYVWKSMVLVAQRLGDSELSG